MVFGVAVKPVITGKLAWPMITVAVAVTVPTLLVAVRVYVMVVEGETVLLPLGFTAPMF
jgi:cytochrome c oxidase subunit IV